MNFDGVMKITIPEGSVKKIECAGKVLWEKAPELVCNPYISIIFKSKRSDSYTTYCYFDCIISGISRTLINSADILMEYYYTRPSGIDMPMHSTFALTISEDADTENKIIISKTTSYVKYDSLQWGHSFALQLKYIDLDGNEQTLTTNYISSVGTNANASI